MDRLWVKTDSASNIISCVALFSWAVKCKFSGKHLLEMGHVILEMIELKKLKFKNQRKIIKK
jgi:hypothetical protein